MTNDEIKDQIGYCTGYMAAMNDVVNYIKSKQKRAGVFISSLDMMEELINPKIRENEGAFRIAGSFIDSSNND